MKKLAFCVVLILAFGCASTLTLAPFTSHSFIEITDSDSRIYHLRYAILPTPYNPIDAMVLIEGIRYVTATPYQVLITKSKAYTWNEIEPHIKKVLQDFQAEVESILKNPFEFYEEKTEEKEGI